MLARLVSKLGQWPVALAVSFVLAAVILLPGLDATGLWDPQERSFADQKAPRAELQAQRDKTEADAEAARQKQKDAAARAADAGAGSAGSAAGSPTPTPTPTREAGAPPTPPPITSIKAKSPPPAEPDCERGAPKDAFSRTLTARAAAWGRDVFGDSDAGRRLPLALLGLVTALAIAGTAMRLAGPRAGVIACAIGLSFPMFVLESRQLTSEIGTACGASLIVFGLASLPYARRGVVGALDGGVSAICIPAGAWLAVGGGGVLLGLVVPLGAIGLAGGFGVPALRRRDGETAATGLAALLAGALAIAALAYVAYQVYDLKPPTLGANPPQREIFGKAIVASPCWSSALGATMRADDDLRNIFDSSWEQIAYGTYPWGLLAPIAMAALLGAADSKRRRLGAITLAWAGCAWVATEVFQRKVGFTLFAGFPALAIAVGAWLDDVLGELGATRAGASTASTNDDRSPSATTSTAAHRGLLLVGVFAILATLDIGKDLQEFPDRTTSLLVGGDAIPYPVQAHLALIPARLWILILGVAVGLAWGLSLLLPASSRRGQRAAVACGVAAIALTGICAAFWSFAWQPRLGEHLSSKAMFDTYMDLRAPGDALVIMGDLGDAPHDYAPDATPEVMTSHDQVITALNRATRVFAIMPAGERCKLHADMKGKPYFIVDDRNTRDLLVSNRVDGTTDKNPLSIAISHTEPPNIPNKPKADLVYDNKIQIVGWDIPKTISRGSSFEVTMYYKVLATPAGAWTVLFHFDGPAGLRFNGDHKPIDDLCQTSTWQPGDYIIDRHVVGAGAGGFQRGKYDVWTGFFTGSTPNFKNMPISKAPGDMRDPAATDRIKITTIELE